MQLEMGMLPNMKRWSIEERKVHEVISRRLGKENGILLKDLTEQSGLRDSRLVRATVKSLVEKRSVAICSGGTGFFVPVTDEEIVFHKRDLLARAYSILRRANALERSPAISRLRGQAHLEVEKLGTRLEKIRSEQEDQGA